MQKLVLARARAPGVRRARPRAAGVALSETKADLEALQKALPGPPNSYWDPLALGSATFDWGPQGEEATVGWLRHSEIKHGRVAMAAFVGFIAQCTPLVSGEHKYLPYKGYIFGLIGMLESYGEGAGAPDGYVHYMKGGKPGYYPPIAGRAGWGQVTLDLWDPFKLPGGPSSQSAEAKARGLKSELLNGRAAMAGIFGLISASKVPGSVPFLANIEGFPKYTGDVMVPFSNDFSLF
ncbi:chlorophyll A-B binding protein [Aureococcus anophagefferens]|nr:chlorophyll A-B binding protein [Aureococcus anophagefferens]